MIIFARAHSFLADVVVVVDFQIEAIDMSFWKRGERTGLANALFFVCCRDC